MRVLVTGSQGLVGSAIEEEHHISEHEFVFVDRSWGDLREKGDVLNIFENVKPDVVIHTAARVGGIGGNMAKHEEFFYDNMMMNANVIRNCINFKVKQLFAFSSVCAIPDEIGVLSEERMHDGPVYDSNFAYGYAKRMVDVHIRAAERQYGVKNWCSFIPGNIFGKRDNYSTEYGHIIPSLIHKMHRALYTNTTLEVWGDGLSRREFIYVNDLAKVLIELIGKDIPNRILVSGREEYEIREIVDMLCEVADYYNVKYDHSKPNGQRRRPSSKNVIDRLLPDFKYTSIEDGLRESWNWFCENYPNVRTKYGGVCTHSNLTLKRREY